MRFIKFERYSPMRILFGGYCLIILLGSLLLMLPAASRSGASTSMLDALFTSASATCVTGLIRFDTYTYWSLFGQLVILVLIQTGGVGFMTMAISLVTMTKRKIGLSQRFVMQESVSSPQIGGIVRMTKLILFGTLCFEGTGALLLSFYFIPRLGFGKGMYFSVFHAVSAFCNAGFDLMGSVTPFSSLTSLQDNPYVAGILMGLIVIGGLGFFVWSDLLHCRFRFKRLSLHTKLVLTVSLSLILIGILLLLLFEQGGSVFEGKSFGQQLLYASFQSISPRTAGFNSVDLPSLRQTSQFLMVCLMLLGGSTGSTAGGMKTTTLAVLLLSISSVFRQKKSIECFGRRIDDDTIRTASCVLSLYLGLTVSSALLLASLESLPILTALFEVASAIGTTGLSLGITPNIGAAAQVILILLMLFGRVGSITFLLAFASEKRVPPSKLPQEKIQIG